MKTRYKAEPFTHEQFKNNIFSTDLSPPFQFEPELIPSWFEAAAVLVLFWDEAGTIKVVMTKRSSKLAKHKGEVCFPGGRVNFGESRLQAALRESAEEIGILPAKVEITGRLSDAWSGAAFHMVPFVGWYRGHPQFRCNRDEVAEILILDVWRIIHECRQYIKTVKMNGVRFFSPVIEFRQKTIVGLSADILLEAIDIGRHKTSERGPKRCESLRHALANGFFDKK